MIDITRQFYAYFDGPSGWVQRPCRFAIDPDRRLLLKDETTHLKTVPWTVVDMEYEEVTTLLTGPNPSLEFRVRGAQGEGATVRSDFARVRDLRPR